MMRWLSRFWATTGIAATLLALAAPAQAEKRVALVIGNNDYRNVPKLQKAVNDARTMGDTLKQLGFSVMVAENQTRQAFSESLLAFDRAVGPGDTAFFFYAGHGFEIAGQNFLLPTTSATRFSACAGAADTANAAAIPAAAKNLEIQGLIKVPPARQIPAAAAVS